MLRVLIDRAVKVLLDGRFRTDKLLRNFRKPPSQVAKAQDVSNDSQFCFHCNLNKPRKINGLENHKKLLAFALRGLAFALGGFEAVRDWWNPCTI